MGATSVMANLRVADIVHPIHYRAMGCAPVLRAPDGNVINVVNHRD
jgi:hypothetical protein